VQLYLDAPSYNSTVSGNAVGIVGWATDPYRITALSFQLDGQPLSLNAPYVYGAYRPSVCNAYPGDPNCPYVGFSANFDSTRYANGSHALSVTATDSFGQQATTSNWWLTFSNAAPPPPVSSFSWIQPQFLAGYGPPGSLIVAGNATGGNGGTVQLWYQDVTAGDVNWTLVGNAALPGSDGTWLNAIQNVNFSHTYTAVALYSGIWTRYCTYPGDSAFHWCP
jgi:hypothetical protein